MIDIFVLLKNDTFLVFTEVIAAFLIITGTWACGHVLLYKRDTRAAAAWLGLIILTPGIGTFFYFAIGINRIRRKAGLLKGDRSFFSEIAPHIMEKPMVRKKLTKSMPFGIHHNIEDIVSCGDSITGLPLTCGNSVKVFTDPRRTFREMLGAINGAKKTIVMQSYIFDNDAAGLRFCDALSAAVRRGVSVKLLIDDAGSKYSKPRITKRLHELGLRYALFLEAKSPLSVMRYNLRNHRKMLIVDGKTAFTGGMNIRDHFKKNSQIIQDTHFKLSGPVISQMMKFFSEDWMFSGGGHLTAKKWHVKQLKSGNACARVITSGPDRNFEKNYNTLLSAISNARRSICIRSPYFIPDSAMIRGLSLAVLQGVNVKIIVPENNNLKYVKAAMEAHMPDIIAKGCEVYTVSGPFDHTKNVIVDEEWVLIGSTNWDDRSFRLNFELDVEVYNKETAHECLRDFNARLKKSKPLTLGHYARLPLIRRLKNSLVRILSPYL